MTVIFFGPFIERGLFFSLDNSFADKATFVPLGNPNMIWGNCIWLLNQVFPMDIVQKIIYIGIMSIIVFGSWIVAPTKNAYTKFVFTSLIAWNPFVIERLVAGQYLVLFGYGMIVQIVARLLASRNWKDDLYIAGLVVVTACFSVHFAAVGVGICLVRLIVRQMGKTKKLLSKENIPTTIGVFVILVMYVLFSFDNASWQYFMDFSRNDLYAFKTGADDTWGIILSVLGGYGFWFETYEQFISAKTILPFWPVVAIATYGLGIVGYVKKWKTASSDLKESLMTLGIIWISCLILVLGVAVPWLEQSSIWIYDHFRVLYILREPQKVVGVMQVIIALGCVYALDDINISKKWKYGIGIMASIYFIAMLIIVYMGVRMSSYPKEWFSARTYLQENLKKTEKIILFPWHRNMPMSFAYGKYIANPSGEFFGGSAIMANNYDLQTLYSHDKSLERLHIEGLIAMEWDRKNLQGDDVEFTPDWGVAVQAINAKYIVVLKEYDWKRYNFLRSEQSLKIVMENKKLIIYEVQPINMAVNSQVDNPIE